VVTEPIGAEGLAKRYGETLAAGGPDLAIEPGEVYGYLGPNGAGKTTTIRLPLCIHRPTRGRAALFGIDAWADRAGQPGALAGGDLPAPLRRTRSSARCRYPVRRLRKNTRRKPSCSVR
jgi:ABC-type Fe3+/spermidine/putrescine transport system ATPase subunit